MEEMRIAKLMAQRGMCSRREAEKFISEGRVLVNGEKVTTQGVKAPANAKITLDRGDASCITVALHKPLGIISNLPQNGQKEARDLLTEENRFDQGPPIDVSMLHVVGRLDINSKGLLLFSSDGRVARKIIGPGSEVEKEYIVRFSHEVPAPAIRQLRYGLMLDGKKLKRAEVNRAGEKALIIILREGKKRQIRRMCELVDLEVTSLKRVRVGDIQLGNLPPGKWQVI